MEFMFLLLCSLVRYYDLDVYHQRMMEKEKRNGLKNAGSVAVRTVFNDEEVRRYVDMHIFWVCIPAITKHGTP